MYRRPVRRLQMLQQRLNKTSFKIFSASAYIFLSSSVGYGYDCIDHGHLSSFFSCFLHQGQDVIFFVLLNKANELSVFFMLFDYCHHPCIPVIVSKKQNTICEISSSNLLASLPEVKDPNNPFIFM